uniref:Hemicentin 1 n=1 Tax=Anser brachyrhynchus TaxID=132585 RepID=A0A8B9BNN6_9AVES
AWPGLCLLPRGGAAPVPAPAPAPALPDKKASTLTFVFDVTGSMYDDLVQVIEGASKILETSLKRPKRPLYNFALVPFHDPEIGPVTITTDPKKFQFELRELYVQGGGDCPEMSIGAIKIALEISLPGSFIYVFTDARSKDYRLAHEVLQLIQQKQSQVVFVLTGDCDDRDHIGYKVYEEIASTSSGQVFHLDKKQVNEVLKWVEEAVQASKVHLLSTDHLTMAVNTWQIPFDPSLKEVTVSLSGPSPAIEIRDPLGEVISKGSGLNELLNIHNSAKVVNVKDPEPGTWTIKVYSGRHSVRITGLSTIDFRAGFSKKPTLDFKKTSSRPVQGIPTFVLLNTTGILLPARVDRLELLSITGELLKTLPVKYYPDRKPYGLWNISDFIPPDEAFFVKIMGYDKDDYLFQRVSSVSFSSITPDAPKVTMPSKTPGYYLQPGSVPCHVESLIPFTQRFTKNGVKLGEDQFFKESSSMSWEIDQVSLSDEGFYECIATSSAGTGRATAQHLIQDPPPMIQVPNNVTAVPGEAAILTCLTLSTVRYNLTWQRNGRDVRLKEPLRITVLSNLSLEVKTVKFTDAGKYNCIASNEGGSTTASVFLTVQEPPRVVISPKNQTFTEGSEVSIRCSATGYPKPTVVWTHNEMLTPEGTLIIRKAIPKDEGVYGCLASNSAGTAKQTSTLTYIGNSVGVIMVNTLLYFILFFFCLNLGDLELRPSAFLIIDSHRGLLKIQETQDLDAGDYTCVATNDAGTASGKITLDVGCNPDTANVIEGQQLTLPCVLLAGNPIPDRRWIRNSMLVPNPYINVRSDGSLHLERVRLQDGGDYTCMASNVAGTNNKTTTVNVYVLPVIQHGQQIFSTIEGIPVTLPCKASGVPKPSIVWSKKGEVILPSNGKFSAGSDGSLYVVSPGGEETGEYVCTATNAAGYATRKVQLTVYVKPRVSRPGDQQGNAYDKPIDITVTAGEDVTLPCEVKSLPPPIITWAKEMQLISPHTFLPSGSMKISETQISDGGMYFCVATNIAGNVTQSVKLSIHVPPKIQRGPRVMKVQAGHRVDIPCSAQGIPPPTVTWFRGRSAVLIDGRQFIRGLDGSLSISNVQLPDAGIYKCVASNSPTIDDLDPPYNSPFQERVANQRIAFPCPARGIPKPVIKWLRNGRELTGSEPGISILEDGTLLVIASVTPSDNGEYICVATNEAGNTERKYNLKVHVPPEIRDQEKVTNTSVVVNHPVSLFCEVSGNPFPIISWYKEDTQVGTVKLIEVTIAISSSRIFSATDDSGQYSCKAINVAGSSEKLFNLDILVPPSIIGADTPSEIAVILNQEISLECRAKGFPFPDIHWFKDGKPLFLGDPNVELLDKDQVLHIRSARRIDKGRYQCSATNTAGKQVKEIKLIIHVPPSIKGGNITTEVSALLNNLINLECETKGIPVPTITWYKEGRPMISSPQALYVDRGQFLQIPRAQVSDSAKYTCHVTNAAGVAEKIYEVDVYVPPVIEGDAETAQSRQVVAGNSLTLECKAAGNPPPLLTWLKDGVPVKASSNLRIVSGGKKLEILNAIEADRGQYLCVATSIAGEKEIKYEVEILVPPFVEGGDELLDYFVILHSPLELDCSATGTPSPTILWLKDGQPVEEGAGHKILLNGQKLLISRAQVSDTGRYKCVAANTAGEHEKEFDVTVHGRLLKGQKGSRLPLLYMAGKKILKFSVFFCFFLFVCFCISGATFRNRGQVLQIEGAQISDTGIYKCVTVNAAGSAELFYNLQVHGKYCKTCEKYLCAPLLLFSMRLECEARGIPAPILTWLKDGSPVSSFSDGLQVLSGGRVLALTSAQISDTGKYTCVAVNAAGESQRDIDLRVYVPPNIMGEEQNVSVLISEAVELLCQSNAVPPPVLTWLKDGRPLLKKPGLSISEDGSVLKVNWDTGRYTCEATNVAGKTEKNYNVNIWARPTVFNSGSHPSEVVVTQGNEISLECKVQGIPEPAVTWMKDGHPLVSGRDIRILHDGRFLQLRNAQVSDTGRYVCVAVNVAGLSDRKYDLNVHGEYAKSWAYITNKVECFESKNVFICFEVTFLFSYSVVPPSIAGDLQVPENISTVEKNPVSLVCEASGIPLPSITWLKNGWPVTLNSTVRILSGGRTLRLTHTTVSDEGQYTCVVTNAAGEARKDFDLSVLGRYIIISVTIEEEKIRGYSVYFAGNPVPQITWVKDGRPLTEDEDHKFLSSGRFLQITNAQVTDTGRYTCIASNTAGDKSKSYSLNVLVSPVIVGADSYGNAEEITVILNSPTSLVCEAYSYPPATITWLKDGNPLESNRNIRILPGGRTLQILSAQEDNAGRYTCIATNEAGETLKHYEVKVYIPPTINKGDSSGMGLSPKEVKIKVNHSLTLECEAHAIPAAAISWYKDGQPLKPDDHVIIQASGHFLQIKEAQVSDTGRYTCLASNIAGEDEVEFDVNIQVPPSFQKPYKGWETGNMVDTGRGGENKDVIVNNPLSLYCETNAVPPPVLTWYKDGYPLSSSDKVLILPGGRVLQIPRVQAEDAGRYMCVAVNEAGEDSIHYDVRVLLPPSISGADGDLPEEVTVLVNKVAVMDCVASGSPSPSITWEKDGHLLAEDDKPTFLSNGRRLQVALSEEHTGRYVCVVENIAGSAKKYFNLNVHVPPNVVGTNPENLTVVVNNFISLTCEVTGFPPPDLSWLKNGKPINLNANTFIVPGARTLQIPRAKLSDDGEYTCVARNQAGESQKRSFLTVLVPPSIKDHSGTSLTVLNVRVGTPVMLECESNAIPPPVITWYKNRRIISESANVEILADGQTLRIKGAEVGQTSIRFVVPPHIEGPEQEWMNETIGNPVTFVCDATGIPPPKLAWFKNGKPLGNIPSCSFLLFFSLWSTVVQFVVFFVFVHLSLVPPNIVGSEMPSEVGVLLGERIQLVCDANGVPMPVMQWLKDGKTVAITPDGSTLTIFRALTSDTGKYTCVATNPAGEEDQIFNLNVYVPPTITNNKDEPEDLTALLDTSINIECTATGTPSPQINWLKNGLPLSVSSQIRLLSAGQILRLVFFYFNLASRVFCLLLASIVGSKTLCFSAVPPSLDNAGGTEDMTVVKGSSTSMKCFTDGTPAPTMSWFKNGHPLSLGAHLISSDQGMVLHFVKAEIGDTGKYTCVASNEAGDISKHFSLKVLEPPHINGSDQPEELSVIVDNPLELLCTSTGIPVPKISWMKDGRPLLQNDNVHVLREDTGRYTCLASSPAGDDDKEYLVRVHVPPNIAGTSGPQDLTVLQNRQVILECKSDAVPPPTISWLKNGELLEVQQLHYFGRYLQINNADLSDTASYTCVASNIAGKMTREFVLTVHVAPTIRSSPQTTVVHINASAVLECIAEGVPTPRITWRKDGQRFHPFIDGSLHIHSAHVTDTGRYMCMATNTAGTERKRIDLQVLVPPTIAPGHTNITVTVNVQTTLPCETAGIPRPAISWKKNGHLLSVDQNQNTYRLLSSGSLVIISPTVDDTAVYECSVSNDAGEDQRAVELTVQVPPSIADEATDVLVTKLSPVVISCTASGVPIPSVHWTKNGIKLLPRGDGYRILSSGAVEIPAAQLVHAGRYTCVARNAAGSAHRHATLHVQEPPVIQTQPGMLDVIVNNPILLPCEAMGTPQPIIMWQKEGINIITAGNGYMVLPSGSLQIAKSTVEDAGTYTCVAQNPAGTALGKIKLKVQVPPVIKSHLKEHVVPIDQSVNLQCEAEGYPGPEISWHKDGQQITESMRRRVLSSGTLQIVFPEDSGNYTCIANNAAGEDTHTVILIVHVLPAFTELPGDVALTKGEQLRLTCKATGIPIPKITWTFNNNIIPGGKPQYDDVNGHSELVIDRVSKDDSGTYVCTAENTVGSVKAIGFVYVKEPPVFKGDYHPSRIEPLGGNAMLNCEVRGDPPPTIQWSKKGVDVQISNRIQQLNNGSLAIYGTVNEDAGDYKCVATNDAGVVERSLTLTLQSPPVITIEPAETVIEAGATAMLNCQANGEPPPTIKWSRQGHPVVSEDRVTVLSNGSLRIVAARKEDTSEYECVARNLMGSVLVRVPLIVQGGPSRAKGSIIGNINNIEFGIAFLNATVVDSLDSENRVIQAKITNIPQSLGPALRKLVSILSPVYWTTAKEIGEAMNGFTLTDAVFKRETQVEFATGEILRMTHIARGLDSDGALMLDVVVSGHVLQLQSLADVNVKDYTEDYIQTGPGQLYAHSTRLFTIDGVSVPYTWNHTITYDYTKGKMPFLVETLHASSITTEYNPLEETVAFKIHASIAKDEDECVVRNPCSHTCHNAIGTYHCSCPKGLTISADGRTCQDIDECALGGHTCHAGQDCENIIGSYRCVVRCGNGFRRTADGFSCQGLELPFGCWSDINECEQVPKPCAFQCTNTPGSFKCICPPGQHLLGDGKSCAGLERLNKVQAKTKKHVSQKLEISGLSHEAAARGSGPRPSGTAGLEPGACSLPSAPCLPTKDDGHTPNIDECETRDTCQHECRNTLGSYQCTCPPGYRLTPNGKTCQDIDECLEQNIDCGSNQMCFNMRGSYQCIDTPCPPNYQREPLSGFCLKNCPANDLECALSTYALEYKLLSLPFGIAAGQDLIRLVAYTQDQVMHPRTTFLMADEDPTIPFTLRDENLKGVVFTIRPLREPKTYRMRVRALSYSIDGNIEYQTTFIVYIAVSAYPY